MTYGMIALWRSSEILMFRHVFEVVDLVMACKNNKKRNFSLHFTVGIMVPGKPIREPWAELNLASSGTGINNDVT